MSNEPIDSTGNPLRPAATATDPWQSWRTWSASVEARLRSMAGQADSIQRQLRTVLDQTVGALEKLAIRSKEQREARELLAASCQQAFNELEARIATLEGAGAAPALTPQELEQVQRRLRGALAGAIDAAAAQRLGNEQARPVRPSTTGLSVHGIAHGEVLSPPAPSEA